MAYLLDTDVVIDHLETVPGAEEALDFLVDAGLAITAITYMEAFQGVLRNPDVQASHAQFEDFLEIVNVLPFSVAEARRCAEIRHALQQRGRRVRSRALDLMTAALAIEHELTLVTRNVADYQDIPGLSLLPWQPSP